jgi:prephenate dehydrogenase
MEEPGFTDLAQARVAVVGLGLMGGSLALALRGRCQALWGVDSNPTVQAYACQHAVIDDATDLAGALEAEVLVLAAPPRAILAQLAELAGWPAPPGRPLVLDLGSTKSEIAAAMRQLPQAYAPIGGHPMCGKEVSGLAQAEAGLFQDKVFVLTPLERTPAWALSRALDLIAAIGARPLELTPERHDQLAAAASHLPYLAATLLVRAAEGLGDDQIWQMAASGFRDTSRLAASDVTMMTDILLTNREAIRGALERYQAELGALLALLDGADAEALSAFLAAAAERRRGLFQP